VPAAIEVRDLKKSFPPDRRSGAVVDAVRNISFVVEPGERLAYIGPNGAGKSTSIKILTGVLHPTSGHATVLGLVPWQRRRELARRIGALFGQRSQLWAELTPRESLTLLAAIYEIDRSVAPDRIAVVAGLFEAADLLDVPVRSLSLGQRMRCELAASMLHDPDVLFLDEPTIGLDLVAKQRFRELLVRLNAERGTTILLTSHDVSDIEQVARRVIVINHGELIYDDEVSRMRRSLLARKLVEVRFERAPGDVDVEAVEVVKATDTGYKLVVDTTVRPVRDVLDDLLDRYPVADISVLDPPMEEVIASIYEGRA
jgi:ABC-2 type transport system ATP-binding protein